MSHGLPAWGAGALRGCCSDKTQKKRSPVTTGAVCSCPPTTCGAVQSVAPCWLPVEVPLCHSSTVPAQPTVHRQGSGRWGGSWRGLWHGHTRSLRRGIPDRSVVASVSRAVPKDLSQAQAPGQGCRVDGTGSGQSGWVIWRCHSEEEVVTWGAVPGGLSPMACYPCCSQGEHVLRLLAQGAGSRLGSILAGSPAKCCMGTGTILDKAPGGC